MNKPPPPQSNSQFTWLILLAAVAWGAMIGVGAMIYDLRRGLIVFGVLALFAGFWSLLLLAKQRKNQQK